MVDYFWQKNIQTAQVVVAFGVNRKLHSLNSERGSVDISWVFTSLKMENILLNNDS